MAELSFELQTLEPLAGALDIIRYFGSTDQMTADADEICDGIGLSDRSFGKAIRRLVTKGYVQMDGNQVYRLTEKGQRAVEELAVYDAESPAKDQPSSAVHSIQRRLVLVVPRKLVVGQPANVVVGFHAASDGDTLPQPADMVIQLSAVNGEPGAPKKSIVTLSDDVAQQTFQVTPGQRKKMRIRVQVFQLDPNSDDVIVSGGMYVDLDVATEGDYSDVVAYGTSVTILSM